MKIVLPNKVKLLAALLFLVVLIFYPGKVQAATSCTASVSPSSIAANSTGNVFTFSVTNTGDSAVDFVTIRRPSGDFFLNNIGVPGWTVGATSELAFLSDGNIDPGSSTDFIFHVSAGPNEVASTNWSVSVGPGGSETDCTGSLGTAISGTVDATSPVISSVSVVDITTTSVSINWTTDESSDSTVGYDTDSSYATEVRTNDATLTTSHSVGLSGLTAGTAYYYYVESVDGSGNTGSEDGGTFTTATTTSAGTSTSTTTTTTVTVTATAAPIVLEKTAPKISLTDIFDEPFEEAPKIKGKANDNKGVTVIEYSTDGGVNWLPVDDVDSLGSLVTDFSFTPLLLEDGNYDVLVRAKDSAGNIGVSKSYILVIDRLPPRIGGNLFSLGPHILFPNKQGVITTLAGVETRIIVSAVGGPITIDIYANGRMFSLGKSADTGLWKGALNFDTPGVYELTSKAVDGAGNVTERVLNTILVLDSGKILSSDGGVVDSGEVYIYYKDPVTQIWTLWDGLSFGQKNPQTISSSGEYEFYLPPGTYYLKIKSKNFDTLTSKIFEVEDSTPLNVDFSLNPAKKIKIGPIEIKLPNFRVDRTDIVVKSPQSLVGKKNELIGKEAPFFILPTTSGDSFGITSLRGSVSIVTFVNTWSPSGVEQISVLDESVSGGVLNHVFVSNQEGLARVKIFKGRGRYKSEFVIDKDGELSESYNLTTLPTHFFLDRRGIVEKIVTGVLNEEEIKEIVASM